MVIKHGKTTLVKILSERCETWGARHLLYVVEVCKDKLSNGNQAPWRQRNARHKGLF